MKEMVYRVTGSTAFSIALIADTYNVEPCLILESLSAHLPDIIGIIGDILVGHGKMIISRGLSNTASVPRLFNEPEIVYVEVGKDG